MDCDGVWILLRNCKYDLVKTRTMGQHKLATLVFIQKLSIKTPADASIQKL